MTFVEKLINGLILSIKDNDWLMVDAYIEELKAGELNVKYIEKSDEINKSSSCLRAKITCSHCMGFGDYPDCSVCKKCGGSGDTNNIKMSSIKNGVGCK
jgi:RecJ-like exonuclease